MTSRLPGAAAAALAAATVAAAAAASSPTGFGVPPGRGGVVRIDAAHNRVAHVFVLSRPNVVTVGDDGAAWVTQNARDRISILRIVADRAYEAVRVGRLRTMIPDDLAVDGHRVIVLRGDAVEVYDGVRDRRPQFVRGLRRGSLLVGVAVGYGAIWVLDGTTESLVRIDARQLQVTKRIALGMPIDRIAVGGSRVWVTSAGSSLLVAISPRTASVTRRYRVNDASTVAVDGTTAWVVDAALNRVVRLDLRTGHQHAISVGAGPAGIAITKSSVWVVDSRASAATRIDRRRAKVVATVPLPERPYWIAGDDRSVWVTFLGHSEPKEVE